MPPPNPILAQGLQVKIILDPIHLPMTQLDSPNPGRVQQALDEIEVICTAALAAIEGVE